MIEHHPDHRTTFNITANGGPATITPTTHNLYWDASSQAAPKIKIRTNVIGARSLPAKARGSS